MTADPLMILVAFLIVSVLVLAVVTVMHVVDRARAARARRRARAAEFRRQLVETHRLNAEWSRLWDAVRDGAA